MNPRNLLVRCYAERRADGVWQAFSIEFSLAAQADTVDEVKRKLESQILSYVHEALAEDVAYVERLLSREAPLQIKAKFYYLKLLKKIHNLKGGMACLFVDSVPMVPKSA